MYFSNRGRDGRTTQRARCWAKLFQTSTTVGPLEMTWNDQKLRFDLDRVACQTSGKADFFHLLWGLYIQVPANGKAKQVLGFRCNVSDRKFASLRSACPFQLHLGKTNDKNRCLKLHVTHLFAILLFNVKVLEELHLATDLWPCILTHRPVMTHPKKRASFRNSSLLRTCPTVQENQDMAVTPKSPSAPAT